MFGSAMLDVAIGLIFLYLVLSLICSAVVEIFESWLKYRAKDLEKGIRNLLDDPDGTALAKQLYEHPLINSLYLGTYESSNVKLPRIRSALAWFKKSWAPPSSSKCYSGRNLPSYIPARNFAIALMDLALPATQSKVSDESVSAKGDKGGGGRVPPQSLTRVRGAIASLKNAAGGNLDRARKNVEEWFDSSMDRVSGWYKRRAQAIILVLGFGVAFAMNADTIAIGSSLARDKAARESVVAFAQKYAESAAVAAPGEAKQKLEDAMAQIGSVSAAGLPLGWDTPGAVPKKDDWWGWPRKVFGLLITAIAISLGAPFWFDLLKKFVSVRAAGKVETKNDTTSRGQGAASGKT